MRSEPEDIAKTEETKSLTVWLRRMSQGDAEAAELVANSVYRELKHLARSVMAGEPRHNSLQPTLLVNEAFLRLIRGEAIDWQDRRHFYVLAGRMMRRIVIDYFRNKSASKRFPGALQVSLEDAIVISDERREEVLIIDEALNHLAEFDPAAAQVVELRYFAGLTMVEIANVMKKDPRTVKRHWTLAQAWLRQYLTSAGSGTRKRGMNA